MPLPGSLLSWPVTDKAGWHVELVPGGYYVLTDEDGGVVNQTTSGHTAVRWMGQR